MPTPSELEGMPIKDQMHEALLDFFPVDVVDTLVYFTAKCPHIVAQAGGDNFALVMNLLQAYFGDEHVPSAAVTWRDAHDDTNAFCIRGWAPPNIRDGIMTLCQGNAEPIMRALAPDIFDDEDVATEDDDPDRPPIAPKIVSTEDILASAEKVRLEAAISGMTELERANFDRQIQIEKAKASGLIVPGHE